MLLSPDTVRINVLLPAPVTPMTAMRTTLRLGLRGLWIVTIFIIEDVLSLVETTMNERLKIPRDFQVCVRMKSLDIEWYAALVVDISTQHFG